MTYYSYPTYASAPFSPAQLPGLEWWLDASDDTSISLLDGSVFEWRDKSVRGRHLNKQLDAAKRPALISNGINQKSVVRFDGVDDILTRDPFLYDLGDITMFMVVKGAQQSQEARFVAEGNTDVENPFYAVGINPGGRSTRLFIRNDAGAIFYNIAGQRDIMDRLPSFITIRDSYTNYSMEVNEQDDFGSDYTRAGTLSLNTLSLGAAQRTTTDSYFKGDIAEILVYHRQLSEDDITRVESYLKHKWYTDAEAFFLLGQSNADGFRELRFLPEATIAAYKTTPDNIHMYYKPMEKTGANKANDAAFTDDGQWYRLDTTHDDALKITHQTVGDLDDGVAVGSTEYYGVELEYGRQHMLHNPDTPLFMLKTAIGGSALGSSWDIQETTDPFGIWRLFKEFVHDPAIADLRRRGIRLKRPRIFWMQGESDATETALSVNYETHLDTLVSRMSTELYHAEPYIIIGSLSTRFDEEGNTNFALVKAAQRSIAEQYDHVALLPTDGTGHQPAYPLHDNLHYDEIGFSMMGEALYHLGRPNQPPVNITLSNVLFPTSLNAGERVATVSVMFTDTTDTHQYSLAPDPDNLFAVSGNQIIVQQGAAFNDGATYAITVRAVDAAGLTAEQTFSLTAGAAVFSPDYYGNTQGWWDASDAPTRTESGGTISELRDKSTFARHLAQATGTKQPAIISNAVNNLDVIRFDGVDDLLTRGAFIRDLEASTIFLVMKGANQSEPFESKVLVEASSTTNNPNHTILGINTLNDANTARIYLRGDTNIEDVATFGEQVIFDNAASLVVITDTLKNYLVEVDGTLDNSASVMYRRTASATLDTLAVGATKSLSGEENHSSMDFMEMIIYRGAIDDASKAELSAYLRNKWGI